MNLFMYYMFDFLFGGAAYCAIEVVWRGRTHFSMFFAGGIILAVLSFYNLTHPKTPVWIKCIVGAAIITGVEFIFGVIFNMLLNMNVWDYSNVPLNILGQICLPFTLIWAVLSFIIFKWIVPNNPFA